MSDRELDEPIADVIEQRTDAVPDDTDDSDEPELPEEVPLEADEADTAEQARVIELGEDEYR